MHHPGLLARLAMLYYCLTFGGFTWVWLAVLRGIYLLPHIVIPLITIYMSYVYFIDMDAMRSGSWTPWARDLRVWKYMKLYFKSASLEKTEELGSGPYLFVHHPHGILAMGSWLAFGTNALGFPGLFPKVRDWRLVTLNVNFWAPFLREFLLSHGVCSCAKQSLLRLLRLKKSVVLVLGGGSESLLSSPNTYDLVLKRRRGFIKVALETGTSLVPVISFGETNTYRTVNQFPYGNWIRKIQRRIEKRLGFTIPIVLGTGVFLPYGLLPRHNVTLRVVVGKPLEVPCVDPKSISNNEFQNLVETYHQQYINALLKLFDENKEDACLTLTLAE